MIEVIELYDLKSKQNQRINSLKKKLIEDAKEYYNSILEEDVIYVQHF
jgi:hypothetical protein